MWVWKCVAPHPRSSVPEVGQEENPMRSPDFCDEPALMILSPLVPESFFCFSPHAPVPKSRYARSRTRQREFFTNSEPPTEIRLPRRHPSGERSPVPVANRSRQSASPRGETRPRLWFAFFFYRNQGEQSSLIVANPNGLEPE